MKISGHIQKIMNTISFALCCIIVSPASSAGWQLYDDFSSGMIDSKKWNITGQGTRGNIYTSGGKLVIEHFASAAADSIWLKIKQKKSKIRGIRVDVKANLCAGEPRGRAGGQIGKWQTNKEVWGAVELRAYEKRASGFAGIENFDNSGNYLGWARDESFGGMYSSENLWDKWRTIQLRWSESGNWVEWKAQKLNAVRHTFPRDIKPAQFDPFNAIGTRRNDDGSSGDFCTVRFDNVKVYIP